MNQAGAFARGRIRIGRFGKMHRFLQRLYDRQRRKGAAAPASARANAPEPRVLAPAAVDLHHPANREKEIKVPASVNGRDLGKGRP